MLEGSPTQVAGDADIENVVASIGFDIDPAASHGPIQEDVDGRDKPGHDGRRGCTVYGSHVGWAKRSGPTVANHTRMIDLLLLFDQVEHYRDDK